MSIYRIHVELDKQGLLHLVSGVVPPTSATVFLQNYGVPKNINEWEWDMVALVKLSEDKLFNIYQEIRRKMDIEFSMSPWYYALTKPFSPRRVIEYRV